ncbi:unnamed protein product [Paramecium sonneborni]|uniref:Uncharacterized protein n=1 Tax=Paramecium sonneborni TaxID=65129 RepID=A0A8S1M1E5_9CILI|nr:unnamed protein product [Paramecium sonneborni]
MHQYPKDSNLLNLNDNNTQFVFKSKDKEQPFSYSTRCYATNQKFTAQAQFQYCTPKFSFINTFANDSTYNILINYKIDEAFKLFFKSPNFIDTLQQFNTGFKLTLEKQYQFYCQYNKTQKSSEFNFFAKKKYLQNDWKMKTILELCFKNKQLQFSQFCQYAEKQDQKIKLTYSQNESSLMIQSPFKDNTQLAFKINRIYKISQYSTFLNFGLRHKVDENLFLITKFNQNGLGIIGIKGKYNKIKYQVSNKFQFFQNKDQMFPLQFKFEIQQ